MHFDLSYLNSTVTGKPFDDAKGRWCVGGGINVPVNVMFTAKKSQGKEIKCLLQQNKIQVLLMSIVTNAGRKPRHGCFRWTLPWTIVQLVNV